MAKPIVAIVGRPNVGKSTLFNKIIGHRISIVEDQPGVTRDRIYAEVEWLDHYFTLIDTGGIDADTEEIIPAQMREQAQLAIETADVTVFMVDGRAGLTTSDREVAEMLRKSHKPVLLAMNKVDTSNRLDSFYEFYELGIGDPIEISSAQGLGIGDLLDEIVKHFPENKGVIYDDDVIKVAIIGKPNVGKSSIVNSILGENRVIVSDIAGTTRDAIDTPFNDGEDQYVLIDTAGLRRKSKIKENIEKYSVIRSIAAVERADVCLLVIDATEGVTEQDTKVAGFSHENGKGTIIVVNKWDLIEKDNNTMNKFIKEIRTELAYLSYAPILFISALTRQRMPKVLETVKFISNQRAMRVPTGGLNEVIGEATLLNQPPSDKGKRLKIFYGTQGSIKPPTFVLFINDKKLMHFSYERYIENRIRENFGFEGTPIRFIYREKSGRD
ncbi:small GTP-binding protein [Alkaliphilus metalliredigens QYMF]|uniref:GTPase Der n=1 Tax=Alkaliphilus metalliredigens (strain QYMF) TaxID=293826 RepID=DER_ALKMQ|nr:ribosome biogenesis GTPase Der [Alkaliphilus metalliredigens]A6TS39.1 RecName: Full=GTPase Der; AltName: Full=GTP-binding protein EngA [Alkaliphilus metalliredigens QYMF]ABR49007.1 small GTP-binding protein [Alkaliphilus metalliredigens QYMF]